MQVQFYDTVEDTSLQFAVVIAIYKIIQQIAKA